jgi:PAS domain S-box-containing protein
VIRLLDATVDSACELCAGVGEERKIRVLHVDDDAKFLAVAKQCLEEQGMFQVDTASSAESALKKLRSAEYDAVVADYQMTGKNGLELLKELRQQGNNVPFILFTCKGKGEVAIEALNAGVERYIEKQGEAEATYEELKHSICSAVKRRNTEKLLKEAENRLHQITENIQDILFLTDTNFTVTYVSASCRKILGYEPGQITGKSLEHLIHPDDLANVIKTVQKAMENRTGDRMEARCRHADGHYLMLEGIGKILTGDSGEFAGTVLTCRDVTENKKSLDKVHFQARLLNAVGQAVIATDMKGTITYWNLAAEQLYGWSEAEVLGRNIVDVTPAENSREEAKNILDRLIAGKRWSGEFLAKRKDGTVFPAIVTDAPIANSKGELIGIVGTSTEITEQKWMQQVLEDAIKEVAELNEKLQVVGGLTRHDVRNKLSALNGRLYLLKKRCNGNVEAHQQITEMESISKQILRILEFEKVYVQVGAEELAYVEVESQLDEAATLFSDLKGIKLVNECQGLVVLADSLLRQMFYNLIDNTLKYGEKTSVIRVHYEEEKDQLKLVYEDDGVGIPDEVRENLFREGYGKGTGYGLYLIQRICEAYGWRIQETGSHGEGARFTMTMPKKGEEDKECYRLSDGGSAGTGV